jgi:glycosyltransferase involved in cell wall biosynthesis
MSRLDPKKSLDLLIDAFHQVAVGPLSHWRLVIAGSGPDEVVSALGKRVVSGPASNRIALVGWVDGEQKRTLLAGASLFASPSAQENFGLSIVEAMASGVPVVLTPGVNLADEVTSAEAGWVVPRTREALAGVLATALGDGEARGRRARAARGLAERFRWSDGVARLIALYESVLSSERVVVGA